MPKQSVPNKQRMVFVCHSKVFYIFLIKSNVIGGKDDVSGVSSFTVIFVVLILLKMSFLILVEEEH